MGSAGADRTVMTPEAPSDSPVQQAPVRHKRHLRNYLIDKKLQLRYVLFVTVLAAVVAGVLGYLLVKQETRASSMILEAVKDDADLYEGLKQSLGDEDRNLGAAMAIVGIGLMAVLSLYLIIMTHKVAGPLYKVAAYFDRMRDGKLPQVHALRKGDQLQDFFEKFRAMDEALRERAKADIELLSRFLAECEKAGVPSSGEVGHRLDELRSLVKEKEASLT